MSLGEKLKEKHQMIKSQISELADKFDDDTEKLIASRENAKQLGVGDKVPNFSLPDHQGNAVELQELLEKGPLVISFYRGSWCPYCSLELNALQKTLPEMEELGSRLVAISPQLPDESLSTVEKNHLSFAVLSDVGNQIANQFGLVFAVSEDLRDDYLNLGIDLPKFNGTDTFELPVPGTYIVDRNGEIAAAYVNADYKQRMEPEEILNVLRGLS